MSVTPDLDAIVDAEIERQDERVKIPPQRQTVVVERLKRGVTVETVALAERAPRAHIIAIGFAAGLQHDAATDCMIPRGPQTTVTPVLPAEQKQRVVNSAKADGARKATAAYVERVKRLGGNSAIRAWADANGITLGMGRVRGDILDAFERDTTRPSADSKDGHQPPEPPHDGECVLDIPGLREAAERLGTVVKAHYDLDVALSQIEGSVRIMRAQMSALEQHFCQELLAVVRQTPEGDTQ